MDLEGNKELIEAVAGEGAWFIVDKYDSEGTVDYYLTKDMIYCSENPDFATDASNFREIVLSLFNFYSEVEEFEKCKKSAEEFKKSLTKKANEIDKSNVDYIGEDDEKQEVIAIVAPMMDEDKVTGILMKFLFEDISAVQMSKEKCREIFQV